MNDRGISCIWYLGSLDQPDLASASGTISESKSRHADPLSNVLWTFRGCKSKGILSLLRYYIYVLCLLQVVEAGQQAGEGIWRGAALWNTNTPTVARLASSFGQHTKLRITYNLPAKVRALATAQHLHGTYVATPSCSSQHGWQPSSASIRHF